MLKIFESIESVWNWLQARLLFGLMVAGLFMVVTLILRMRKAVLFEPWINLSREAPPDLGKSLADLLLFKIREIQGIHQGCIRQTGLWTPYYDVPVFQQELDEDLRLLASFELGNYGGRTTKLMMFLFRLVPMMFQPAKLKGSVHQYGDEILFQVTLERPKKKGPAQRGTQVWCVSAQASVPEQYPTFVEELAYQIYVDLVGSNLFKSWESFRSYTNGLKHYLSYTELHKVEDLNKASKLYEEAVREQPNNPASYYNLGVLKYCLYEYEENEKAIDCFQKALLSVDINLKAQAHSSLSSALSQKYSRFRAGDSSTLQNAILHAQKAIEIDPTSDVANKALAFAYHQQSEVDGLDEDIAHPYRKQAIKHYKKAYTRNPEYYLAYNNLGNLYLDWAPKLPQGWKRQQCLKRAIWACERALDIEPTYQHAYDNIGNAYLALGQPDQTERNYNLALQYCPQYPEGKNDLAMLYLSSEFPRRNAERALTLHFQALSMDKVGAKQKAKLCEAFRHRLDSQPKNSLDFAPYGDELQQLQKLGCCCVASVSDAGRPNGA